MVGDIQQEVVGKERDFMGKATSKNGRNAGVIDKFDCEWLHRFVEKDWAQRAASMFHDLVQGVEKSESAYQAES